MPDPRACVHCGGTGICKHATPRTINSEGGSEVKGMYYCTKCGNGAYGYIKGGKGINSASMPVCGVCLGKGYA